MSSPNEISHARPAATVCLLRDRDGLEVLMVRRAAGASFMAGVWVFPGGLIEDIDTGRAAQRALPDAPEPLRGAMAAAVREVVEETGIWLTDDPIGLESGTRPSGEDVFTLAIAMGVSFDAGALTHFAHWITPTMLPRRFDTHFFAAAAPLDAVAAPDNEELDAAEWTSPRLALERTATGEWAISAPTIRTLESMVSFDSAAAFLEHVKAARSVVPQQPRLRITGEGIEAVAPGDPGFDDLEDLPPDPALLARSRQITSASEEASDAG